jgi:glycerol kinase
VTVRFIAAIEQGTTGTRCMLFNRTGRVMASAYEEHRQITPRPGWVEHDAAELWYKTKKVVAAALDINRTAPEEIAAVGITNQRETTVVWDPETGEPYYNAITSQDTRTRELCAQLVAEGLAERIRHKTGLPLATNFSATKLKWLLDNVEGLSARAEQGKALFGNIDTWLLWNLTGAHVTDYTNASRTLLWNLQTCDWDDELLQVFGIPRAMLPQVHPSTDARFCGYTRARGPFGGEIPVCGDLGDEQAALLGQACFERGEAKNTYGTGNLLLLNTGRDIVTSRHGALTTVAYAEGGEVCYALEGSVAVTGAAVQWLRDNLGLIQSAAESELVAQTVEDSGGVYFVPAFGGLDAPHWDRSARGVIVGLTRFATRAHIVRATLEAICYQTREVLEAMQLDAGVKLTSLKVEGGATRNNLLVQLQADILGIPVVRPMINETTALGAAYAAGLAVGYWENRAALRASWPRDRVFEPRWDETRREEGYRDWQRAVERAKNWLVIER